MEQNGMKGVEEQEGRENGIKWKRCEIKKKSESTHRKRREQNTWMSGGIKVKLPAGLKGGGSAEELEIK